MGKQNRKQTRAMLINMRKESEKLERLVAINCNHQKDNASRELDIDFMERDTDLAKCRLCGEIFDMGHFDQKELRRAVVTLNSAIQQIRALSTDDDSDAVEQFGRIAYALDQIPKQYKDTTEAFTRGKKKKKGGKKRHQSNVEWQSELNGLFNQKKKKNR